MTKRKQSIFQNYYKSSIDEPPLVLCNEPGCREPGTYKAPKDRNGNYYQFCLQHVQIYNAKWNYYQSMNENHIEVELRADMGWRRPTWPFGGNIHNVQKFNVQDPFNFHNTQLNTISKLAPEIQQAIKTLELSFPFDLKQLKVQYKKMVKQYHPDTNQHNPHAENILKKINIAYHVLKKFIQ